jgi:putative membrane protein
MLGTASAFTVGFRNNATYGRLWEARQIWGAIVNSSRSWAVHARDLVVGAAALSPEAEQALHRRLLYRHIAWLTALRYQLREPRAWEHFDRHDNAGFRAGRFTVPEHDGALPNELARLLGPDESAHVLAQGNRAAAILALQSADVAALAREGALDSIRQTALLRVLAEHHEQQGKCERLKNFPYPRQFATANYWFIRLFVVLVPFAMLQEFRKLDGGLIWLAIPFSLVVTWIFRALEKVGESSENPFAGGANDVPITAMSRAIEIELRAMLGETDLPAPITPTRDILL